MQKEIDWDALERAVDKAIHRKRQAREVAEARRRRTVAATRREMSTWWK